MRLTSLRTLLLLLVLIALAPQPTYGAGFCANALEKVAQVFRPAPHIQTWVESANERARTVLGDLFPETGRAEVKPFACFTTQGCAYSPAFHIIQMMGPVLEAPGQSAFGPIYIHELAHSIQYSDDPGWIAARDLIRRDRNRLLRESIRIQTARIKLSEIALKRESLWRSLWLYFSNAEGRLLQRYERLASKFEGFAEVPGLERDARVDFLSDAAGEVFADLVACAAYQDADAISKAVHTYAPYLELGSRKNSQAPPVALDANVIIHFIDPHDALGFTRWRIWNRYLKDQPDAQVRRTLAILNRVTKEWPATAIDLIDNRLEHTPKINLLVLNRSFQEHFEKTYRDWQTDPN